MPGRGQGSRRSGGTADPGRLFDDIVWPSVQPARAGAALDSRTGSTAVESGRFAVDKPFAETRKFMLGQVEARSVWAA
jgi:hypothetical protein